MKGQDIEFLEQYDGSSFEKPSIAVDLLIFTIENEELKVLLINREQPPFKGMLSLPGVFVGLEESLDEAVIRGLKEKTGLREIYFEQLYTWGEVRRDPRMRIISVSYLALVSMDTLCKAAENHDIAKNLYSVKDLLKSHERLAFDHFKIIAYGRERVQNKAEYMPIAFQFLPDEFTLPQLQRVYEILLDKNLYKANFRKKILPLVSETGEYTSGEAYRPSKLYVRNFEWEK